LGNIHRFFPVGLRYPPSRKRAFRHLGLVNVLTGYFGIFANSNALSPVAALQPGLQRMDVSNKIWLVVKIGYFGVPIAAAVSLGVSGIYFVLATRCQLERQHLRLPVIVLLSEEPGRNIQKARGKKRIK